MINLEPIPKKIQKRLFEKMRALGRQSNSTTGQSIDTDALTHEKMASRTTFIRMTSGKANSVTLMGGLLKDDGGIRGGYNDIYGSRTYKKGGERGSTDMTVWSDPDVDYKKKMNLVFGGDGAEGESADSVKLENDSKRPMPGIKSADIQFKGGQKALREANVSWTCWSFEELNELMPHFLAHGKTVMLQWGWVYGDTSFRDIPQFLVTDLQGNKFIADETFVNYKNFVVDGKGDFDIMTGVIKNFEFTTREDGAFDCTTTITSVGVNLLGSPEPNEESLPEHLTYNLSMADTNEDIQSKMITGTVDLDDSKELNETERSRLVNINTNISLKLFIKNIDNYITTKINEKLNESGNDIKKRKQNIYSKQGDFPFAIGFVKNKYMINTKFYNADTKRGRNTLSDRGEEVENAWVSWGWFEDNVLSKFTSQVGGKSNDVISSFRSIEAVLTTGEGKDSGHYESVRIKNAKFLETIDINNYILPGQFNPQGQKEYFRDKKTGNSTLGFSGPPTNNNPSVKLPGDKLQIHQLARISKENFQMFNTGDVTFKTVRYVDEDLIRKKLRSTYEGNLERTIAAGGKSFEYDEKNEKRILAHAGSLTQDEADEQGYGSTRSYFKTPFGFLRNMLISTKTIKEAFGVDRSSLVESISIEEAMNNLFSILNRPINFWNFTITTDSIDTERAKIIDDQTTKFDFTKSVSSQRSRVTPDGEIYREGVGLSEFEAGVFFFPVWKADSIVKRQNITAKIPDALALTAMYGSNLDQLKELTNPGEASTESGAVIAGGLFNDTGDVRNGGISIALKSGDAKNVSWQNIGTDNHTSNEPLGRSGDDILSYIKKSGKTLETSYTRQIKENAKTIKRTKILQEQAKKDEEFSKKFDSSSPPPLITSLKEEEVFELINTKMGEASGFFGRTFSPTEVDNFLSLFNSKYEDDFTMKRDFISTIKYLTSGKRGELKTKQTPQIIPLDIELDIDGTGGIYPGNSFHSTYLPSKYKDLSVFQMFDVSHKVDSSGWTTSITGRMRSTLASVFKIVDDYDKLHNDVFGNYVDKGTAIALRQREERLAREEARKKAIKDVGRRNS